MKAIPLYSTNRSQLRRGSFLIALGVALACFALSPATQAIEPRRDGSFQSPNQALVKTFYETAKLTAFDGQEGDWAGSSVSIWQNLALIGTPLDDDKGANSGSAYIFAFDGTNWNLQTKLTAPDGMAGDNFGSSVAILGNRAFIGAPWNDHGVATTGTVYVFSFDGSSWSEKARLTVNDGYGFGGAMSLSGNMALIGTYGNPDRAAYVFAFDGIAWTEQARLTPDDGGFNFGRAVSLSGNRALVGDFDNNGITRIGAAYMFEFDGTTWTQEAKLIPADSFAHDSFGWSVSLSGDLALIGANFGYDDIGAAYIFAFDGSTWNQQAKLAPHSGEGGTFGYAVALDGTRALIGAPSLDAGRIYVFSFDQSAWQLKAKLLASDGMSGDKFGDAISISGGTVLVGAYYVDSDTGINMGAAYTFSVPRH